MSCSAQGAFIRFVIDAPGLAARLLAALAALEGSPAGLSYLEEAAGLRLHDRSLALRLLDGLCSAQILEKGAGGWRPRVPAAELARLVSQAQGAQAALDCRQDRDRVQLVVTFPSAQGQFMEVLRGLGPYYASIALTEEAFVQAAAEARERLVVMTPFLDRKGVEMALKMFQGVAPGAEKILVLRDIPRLMTLEIAGDLVAMRAAGVKIFDYLVVTPDGPLRYETFHSKIVLCDARLAYIGSANLLASSLSVSFEVGVMISGKTVIELAQLVDSILISLAGDVSMEIGHQL